MQGGVLFFYIKNIMYTTLLFHLSQLTTPRPTIRERKKCRRHGILVTSGKPG